MKKFFTFFTLFFSGMIFAFAGIALSSTISFPDVKSTDWFYQDVMNMVNWDVIRGNDDGTFKPSNNVNRAELSAMWNRYDKYLDSKYYSKSEIDSMLGNSSPNDTSASSNNSTEATIGLDNKGILNGVGLTVKSIQDYEGTTYSQPAAGKKFVALDVLIENNSGSSIDVNPLNFSLKDSDSYEYQPSYFAPDPLLNLSTLENGKSVRGYIGYEVPEDANLVELKYEVDYGKLGQFYVTFQ